MSQTKTNPEVNPLPRRNFFKELLAVVAGGAAALIPAGVGWRVVTSPLRRGSSSAASVRVAALSAVPADGIPRRFPVVSTRTDAWNKYPATPIGAVYLRRSAGNEITAFNVACPHAGCFVDFSEAKGSFLCPCHNSSFGVDGKVNSAGSPSPRAMDSLEVEVRNGSEIWVSFKNFRAGDAQKIPLA